MTDYQLLEQQNRSIVDIHLPIYQYIYKLIFICFGFQSHQMGSHYIQEFIECIIEQDIYLYTLGVTKDIYPMIRKRFGISEEKAERLIRYSCTAAWSNTDEFIKMNLFPNGDGKVPTNSEMIYAIYEYVKGHYLFREDVSKRIVTYKKGEQKEETEHYIDYKIRFEIQRFLYQRFHFNLATFNDLPIWIDAIMLSIKANKLLTDEDIYEIFKQLNKIYDFYEGTYCNDMNGIIITDEIYPIMLRFCSQIYERIDESYPLEKPKNKTYIKQYMNVLSSKVKEHLPFKI